MTTRLKRKAAQRKDARRRGEKRFVPSKPMLAQMMDQMAAMRKPIKQPKSVTFMPQ